MFRPRRGTAESDALAVEVRAATESAARAARGYLYLCSCGDPGCGAVWAGSWTAPEAGEVIWADAVVHGHEDGPSYLGPALAFDAEQYERCVKAE